MKMRENDRSFRARDNQSPDKEISSGKRVFWWLCRRVSEDVIKPLLYAVEGEGDVQIARRRGSCGNALMEGRGATTLEQMRDPHGVGPGER